MDAYGDTYDFARLLLQKGMAALYVVAFYGVLRDWRALLGENGLQPAPQLLKVVPFRRAPSIFHWHYSDRFALALGWVGTALATLALVGVLDSGPVWLSVAGWLTLYVLYLSFVNVGQRFYAFGWESMILEAGFFTSFLGPATVQASAIPIYILRWMLFRTELGAGLIKLRHDKCWRDLTCMYYHYETQPMPNPLSWWFHRLPKGVHRASVAFSHFVQIIVPFGLFAPQPIAGLAGSLLIAHQLLLIVSGNYSWLNWVTVVLGFSAFSDGLLGVAPLGGPRPPAFDVVLYVLAGATILMSVQPALNLFSRHQLMNYSYNPFHLVGAYGAFGSMTRKRYEVVLEGTRDEDVTDDTRWLEYRFKAKPGDARRLPPQWAPFHLRLDWLMWFLPFSTKVIRGQVITYGYEDWFLALVTHLLQGDRATLALLAANPFPDAPPTFVRAQYYRYRFTTWREWRQTGRWWRRALVGEYLPPMRLREQPSMAAATPSEVRVSPRAPGRKPPPAPG